MGREIQLEAGKAGLIYRSWMDFTDNTKEMPVSSSLHWEMFFRLLHEAGTAPLARSQNFLDASSAPRADRRFLLAHASASLWKAGRKSDENCWQTYEMMPGGNSLFVWGVRCEREKKGDGTEDHHHVKCINRTQQVFHEQSFKRKIRQ